MITLVYFSDLHFLIFGLESKAIIKFHLSLIKEDRVIVCLNGDIIFSNYCGIEKTLSGARTTTNFENPEYLVIGALATLVDVEVSQCTDGRSMVPKLTISVSMVFTMVVKSDLRLPTL